MPPSKSIPSPSSITHTQFTYLLSLYPSTLKRVYEHKIKDATKRAQALADDAWRYGELVDVLAERRRPKKKSGPSSGGGWLEKAEVERLVRWKMYVTFYSHLCLFRIFCITTFQVRFVALSFTALVTGCLLWILSQACKQMTRREKRERERDSLLRPRPRVARSPSPAQTLDLLLRLQYMKYSSNPTAEAEFIVSSHHNFPLTPADAHLVLPARACILDELNTATGTVLAEDMKQVAPSTPEDQEFLSSLVIFIPGIASRPCRSSIPHRLLLHLLPFLVSGSYLSTIHFLSLPPSPYIFTH